VRIRGLPAAFGRFSENRRLRLSEALRASGLHEPAMGCRHRSGDKIPPMSFGTLDLHPRGEEGGGEEFHGDLPSAGASSPTFPRRGSEARSGLQVTGGWWWRLCAPVSRHVHSFGPLHQSRKPPPLMSSCMSVRVVVSELGSRKVRI